MQKKFKAKAEAAGPGNACCFVAVPFDVFEVWGTRGRVAVKGTINGFPFHTNIQPMAGRHLLTFNKQLQAGAKAKAGDTVSVVMERETEGLVVDVPAELTKVFRKSKEAKTLWDRRPIRIARSSRNGSAAPNRRRPASGAQKSRHHDPHEENDFRIE